MARLGDNAGREKSLPRRACSSGCRDALKGGPLILFGERGVHMLRWAILFLIVAIVAGVFGFGGISVAATDIARLLFIVFLVLFVIAFIAGRRITSPPL